MTETRSARGPEESFPPSAGPPPGFGRLPLLILLVAVVGAGVALALRSGNPGTAAQATASGTAAGAVAFVGVNVIPMDGERVLEDRTVVVRDGRIAALGPSAEVEVPPDARLVEGSGRYLIPGLAEMHAHVPSGEGRDYMERVLFLYLSNGITTIRGMLGDPVHLELREQIARGEVLGPRLHTSGPSLRGASIPDPDSARRAVLYQHRAGYDFLKIHPGLSRASYDAIARTADSVGIRWAGHVPADVGLWRALEARQASIDHLDQYIEALVPEGAETGGLQPLFFGVHLVEVADLGRIPELARATREAGVWNVPTQSLMEHILSPDHAPEEMAEWPEMRYVRAAMVEQWVGSKRNLLQHASYTPERARRFIEIRRHIIKGLHDAGARLLLGSDAPQIFQVPGFSIQAELRMLVASGLSPYEALLTGTRNVAEYFGDLEESGTVEAGKVADLVLLDANPLEDIGNVARQAGVVVRGRWLPAAEIRERLEALAAAEEE